LQLLVSGVRLGDPSRGKDSLMPLKQRISAVLLLLASGSTALAIEQTPDREALARLDGYALALTDAGQFSGVVLVAYQGNVVFEKAYGSRDETGETPVKPDTRFNLGSAGKMFTAVAMLQQIDAGKLTLDSSVGSVLRDYPNPEFAKVTVRQLLTHTAGAGDVDLFGIENTANRARVNATADIITLHGTRAPAFPPGTRQAYGNYGHVVLGRMVEVLSGQDFETYVEQHILVPAGMRHAAFTDCTANDGNTAVGYAVVDGQRVPNCATLPKRGFPAGGQIADARDLLAFVTALQSGKLISPALFAEATRTHREFMGLGFFATGYGADVPKRDFRWGHGGSADGICTDVRSYPLTGETLIVLSNRDPPACYGVANLLHSQWKL
jgi:CubicO group peptidase (beta-lactamase class C family)